MADHPPFAVTADAVLLTGRDGEGGAGLRVLLVRRGSEPFAGRWALPGGFVDVDEDPEVAAYRELREETGVDLGEVALAQLGTYGAPGRDPRGRVLSVAWWARLPQEAVARGADDAAEASWVPVAEALAGELAFDHALVLADAVARARAAAPAHAIAVRFDLPDDGALAEFDAEVDELLAGIEADEPGTLTYAVHAVDGEPLARVFYETYEPGGHAAHEQRPATAAFLDRARELASSVRAEHLAPRGAVRR